MMGMEGGGGSYGGKSQGHGGESSSRRERAQPYQQKTTMADRMKEEVREHKLYVGNLDHRLTEYHVIKMFTPFGKIKREEYMWHTHGPRRGEPRGFAFVEFSKREDAERAKEKMNGRMLFGRPLLVRFVDEKVVTHNDAPIRAMEAQGLAQAPGSVAASKTAKIAAIQNKLRMMQREEEEGESLHQILERGPTLLPPHLAAQTALAIARAKQQVRMTVQPGANTKSSHQSHFK